MRDPAQDQRRFLEATAPIAQLLSAAAGGLVAGAAWGWEVGILAFLLLMLPRARRR